MRNLIRRTISKCLGIVIIFSYLFQITGFSSEAATKTLTLSKAKALAVANSSGYEKIESELEVKQASLAQAFRTIGEKQKNMSTFRWTPLLSFKFPTKPDLAEAYEFQFKTIKIQSEIDSLKHKLTDQVLAESEKVSVLYVDIVSLEESIAFSEARLDNMQNVLVRNTARLKLGEAKQGDIDAMQKSISALESKIASDKRTYENKKKKLSSAIGMDVSTGYRFINPLITAEISRDQLTQLTQYTMDRDQGYYDACMSAETSLISLRTNYSLISGQYGGKMDIISTYVNQALNGQKVSKKPFKKSYDTFLKEIDQPWEGNIKILFIKIPKEWFKGAISGIRYVEDEPYALYEATLEYQDARLEKENTREDLVESVEDSFNNYISVRNAYLSATEAVNAGKKSLKSEELLNKLGELPYEEYAAAQKDYENLQNDKFAALTEYTKNLYAYDRLTCGGISVLLNNAGMDADIEGQGVSYVDEEIAEGAYYYFEPIIQEEQFRLGVSIPDDFSVEVTDFELWCDNIQIGSKTPVEDTVRHLALSTDQVEEVKIRFYNSDEFIDDCVIDATKTSGPLKIVSGYKYNGDDVQKVGSYKSETNSTTGISTIRLTADEKNVCFYRIMTSDEKVLNGEKLYEIGKEFRYLSLVQTDMSDLVIEFFNENEESVYRGYFHSADGTIIKKVNE